MPVSQTWWTVNVQQHTRRKAIIADTLTQQTDGLYTRLTRHMMDCKQFKQTLDKYSTCYRCLYTPTQMGLMLERTPMQKYDHSYTPYHLLCGLSHSVKVACHSSCLRPLLPPPPSPSSWPTTLGTKLQGATALLNGTDRKSILLAP